MAEQISSENRRKETPENTSPQAENEGKKSKKKWLWLILLLILAGGGGSAWYFLFNKETDKAKEHQSSAQAIAPIFMELESFTVNLPPDGQFLQATFTLQVSDETDIENMKLYMPKMRSQMLLLLSNKTADNLLALQGKTLLTEEIMSLLNQPLEKGLKPIKVTHVFITSFIIQ